MSQQPGQRGRRRALRQLGGALGAWASGAAVPAWAQGYGRRPAAAPAEPTAPASAPVQSVPASSAGDGSEVRLALLLGNRQYPEPFDLPPIPKNLRDLKSALEHRGFQVSDALDRDLPSSRAAIDDFVRQAQTAPPNATLLFYFSGHGVQIESANLLLPAGLSPALQADAMRRGSLQLLSDIVGRLPERPQGQVIAVVDACRTTLKQATEDAGLNQVEAPPGCVIAFSTGAGRPAIAPAVETQNTFYTGSLVRLLASTSDETSFSELFQLVKQDVRETMLKHPVEAIRKLAQDPFIADNSRSRVTLAPRSVRETRGPRFASRNEEADWQRLQEATWPPEVLQLADAYLRDHPDSKLAGAAKVARTGSDNAARLLKRSDVRLYKSAFQLQDSLSEDERRDIARAGIGDKDAAARMGRRAMAKGGTGLPRYEGWLQYASALGNGIAAYELALHYRRQEQPVMASRYEAIARELGYNPPVSLDNVRK
ncbi:caspase family protein [Ideonella sp. 4Y11]|uniref:Caspase family protein n=1 Tax=Ideonella aquatica TaxID=2824119 RepID=A0A940YMH5_9BURK|nr:caspase family protein [Ideonella aquatica]MBQ0961322.1 caspase family protein [Ideonella aquatica]